MTDTTKETEQAALINQWMKNVVTLLQNIDSNISSMAVRLEGIEQKQARHFIQTQNYYNKRERSRSNLKSIDSNSRESSPKHEISKATQISYQAEDDDVDLWWKILDELGFKNASARLGTFDSSEKWRVDIRTDTTQSQVEQILIRVLQEYQKRGKRLSTNKIDIAVSRPTKYEEYERRIFRYTWNEGLKKYEGSIGAWVREDRDWLKMTRQMQIENRMSKKSEKTKEANEFKQKYWPNDERVAEICDIVYTNTQSSFLNKRVLKFEIAEEVLQEMMKWCDSNHGMLLDRYFKIEIGMKYEGGLKYKISYKYMDSNIWKSFVGKSAIDTEITRESSAVRSQFSYS